MSSHKTIGMIFAAGRGTRLAPFTDTMPKALVPVAGVPMLERVIRRFISEGITDIVVNVHHFAEQIIRFLQDNENFGATVHISDETDLLRDTGGAVAHAYNLLHDADNVLIHNADILTDISLSELLEHHAVSNADATLLVSDRKSSRMLYFDEVTGRLTGWENLKNGKTLPPGFNPLEATSLQSYAFCGIHVLSQCAVQAITSYSSNPVFSIINFYLDHCDKLNILPYRPSIPYKWFDIGSPEKLLQAQENF